MATAHDWHPGELFLQTQLGHRDAVAGAHPLFRPQLTLQQQQFHTELEILPICTLDSHGRPWASFLAPWDGQRGFIKSSSFTSLVATKLALHDDHPLASALVEGARVGISGLVLGNDRSYLGPALKLVAGVGVMFDNRRRNKLAGFINEKGPATAAGSELRIEIMESLGNCPKYINTRYLAPNPAHNPVVLDKQLAMQPGDLLPASVLNHLAQADAVFLATRYIAPEPSLFKSHLGVNIRGGKTGFVRMATESILGANGVNERRQVLYLPDYSGNRFMSSLGNVYSDRVAGLAVPLFKQGKPIDVLYVTGDAEVLLGQASRSVLPGVSTCVRIVLTGYMYVQDAVPLLPTAACADGLDDFEYKAADGIGWSPYNPPIRRLRSELTSKSTSSLPDEPPSPELGTATLSEYQQHTDALATLTFNLSHPVVYRAGQHIILDCGDILDPRVKEYKHMSDKFGGERELNDAGIRTWSISSAPVPGARSQKQLQITMRRIEGGLVTPRLFAAAKAGRQVALPVLGIGGDFVLQPPDVGGKSTLWIASGIGITPFLAFLRQMAHAASPTGIERVDLVLAMRKSEVAAMLQLIHSAVTASPAPHSNSPIHVHVHLLAATIDGVDGSEEERSLGLASANTPFHVSVRRHKTRFSPGWFQRESGLASVSTATKPVTYLCGTPAFETVVQQALEAASWTADSIQRESFAY